MGLLCSTTEVKSGMSFIDFGALPPHDADEIYDCESEGIALHPIITGGQQDPVLCKRAFDVKHVTPTNRDHCHYNSLGNTIYLDERYQKGLKILKCD